MMARETFTAGNAEANARRETVQARVVPELPDAVLRLLERTSPTAHQLRNIAAT
jgi:hypothetical protein